MVSFHFPEQNGQRFRFIWDWRDGCRVPTVVFGLDSGQFFGGARGSFPFCCVSIPTAGRVVLPKAVGDSCEPQQQRHKKTPSFLTLRNGFWVGCCNVEHGFCSQCSFSPRFLGVPNSYHLKDV